MGLCSAPAKLLLTYSCGHMPGTFPAVHVLGHKAVPKCWMDKTKMLCECRNRFCSNWQS